MWSDTYERPLEDVFAVQDEITRAIVGALQVRLGEWRRRSRKGAGGTTNLAAYDLYLRGIQAYRGRNNGVVDAERYLREAIARDPGYAAAHAPLASVLLVQPFYVAVRPADVAAPARAAAMRAVALDDSMASGTWPWGFHTCARRNGATPSASFAGRSRSIRR